MNIISFSNVKPYNVYQWTTEYFQQKGLSKNNIQLIHPNVRYNEHAEIIICWFIEAFQQDVKQLNKKNVFVVLMDNRKTELEKHDIPIADIFEADKYVDKAIFTSIISAQYR